MQKRFDLLSLAILESRDGGITKGGLVRNGYVELDGATVKWSCMRPALATHSFSPITGTGLGLFILGTVLYGLGVGTSGTSTSWTIAF